ncbi:MAG: hypothetical protein A2X94_03315 [Bdellovibrionales bacterium GWB1_55_8]|nr:MAG: hypothetical protein A2X94_03315 [Bdellovibrionales bacterium GWB1_55_8]
MTIEGELRIPFRTKRRGRCGRWQLKKIPQLFFLRTFRRTHARNRAVRDDDGGGVLEELRNGITRRKGFAPKREERMEKRNKGEKG